MTGVGEDTADDEPFLFEVATTTRIVLVTSADPRT
jgi:hypothetical protein